MHGVQLDRIEMFHNNQFLHRDIKPDNFLVGLNDAAQTVYMIDMGLCKRYVDPATGAHIPYKMNKKLTGTPRYASVNTHMGIGMHKFYILDTVYFSRIVVVVFLDHPKMRAMRTWASVCLCIFCR